MNPGCLLQAVLRDPGCVRSLTLPQWDLLLRQARRAELLGRLAIAVEERGLREAVPAQAGWHLQSARIAVQAQRRSVRWEVSCLKRELEKAGTPVILLKGAAYVMADLPPARGRLFSDIDIMVPRDKLEAVERALLLHGWVPSHRSPYDQKYYRQWMHELPPFQHVRRQTVLDVHHTIAPQTARFRPDAGKLHAAAVPLAGEERLKVLAPTDMVVHSAAHLFLEGEFGRGLRDLADLDELLRHFGQDHGFWQALVARARDLDLERALYYALRYTQRVLATPVPAAATKACRGPGAQRARLMDGLFLRALMPEHASCNTALSRPARWLLYVRGHYLKMPLRLLVPHLIRKGFTRRLAT